MKTHKTQKAKGEAKAPRGRRPIAADGVSVVSVRMPTAWLERYREIATEERRDVAQLLRIVLEDFLRTRKKLE